jgi:hypothetical protein
MTTHTTKPADSIPTTPLALGLAGVIPFLLLLAGMIFGLDAKIGLAPGAAREIMKIYGALIVSFLGGIRWGLGMHRENLEEAAAFFGMSVVPVILAWGAVLLPPPYDLLVLVGTLIVVASADVALARQGRAPAWYGKLRAILTVAVVACLVAALALWPFLQP